MSRKSRLFISYARGDGRQAATDLEQLLKSWGIETFRDESNIPPGAKWREHILQMLLWADDVAFLMSPKAFESPVCQWEIDQAKRLAKRLFPVAIVDLAGAVVPSDLNERNYIYMYTDRVRGSSLVLGALRLKTEIETDASWVHQHQYLGLSAARWQQHGQSLHHVLRGIDIVEAKSWRKRRPTAAPEITALQQKLIEASRLQRVAEWREGKQRKKDVRELEKARQKSPPPIFFDHPNGPGMVVVKPLPVFAMGGTDSGARPNELPVHDVAFTSTFAISAHPVTVAEWNFACTNGFRAKFGRFEATSVGDEIDLPITGVPWDVAGLYCRWYALVSGKPYRLPSEAEWEYCCRAGSTEAFSVGSSITRAQANFRKRMYPAKVSSSVGAAPVGLYPPNKLGIFAMEGNVWEWVEDDYHPNYANAPKDGRPWVDSPWKDARGACHHRGHYRVLRGGSFASGERHLRSARRVKATRTPKEPQKVGFRIAYTIL